MMQRHKLEKLFEEYFDNPCVTCEAVGMDGKCLIRTEHCGYDLNDDMRDDMITEIIRICDKMSQVHEDKDEI